MLVDEDDLWLSAAVRRLARLLAATAALFLFTEILAFAGIVPHLSPVSLRGLVANPLFAIGFASPLLLQISSLPRPKSLALTIALAPLLSLLVAFASGESGAMPWVIGSGIASTVVMTLDSVRSRGRERRVALSFLLAAGVTLFFTLEAAMFLGVVSSYSPKTFDALAYVADASFGANISFVVGAMFRDYPIVATICTLIYLAPPPGLIFLFSLQVKSRRHPPVDIVTTLLAMGAVGYSLYFLFPVCGPKFAFASFPASPPDAVSLIGALIAVPTSPRNGIPSLHMASALIAFTQARRYGKWWSLLAALFVAGTFLATMGTGEHYLVDLVVAVPFTVAMHAAITPALRFRLRAGIVGSMTAVFFLWLAAIRFLGEQLMRHPSLSWSLLAMTVVAASVAGSALWRATGGGGWRAAIEKEAVS